MVSPYTAYMAFTHTGLLAVGWPTFNTVKNIFINPYKRTCEDWLNGHLVPEVK